MYICIYVYMYIYIYATHVFLTRMAGWMDGWTGSRLHVYGWLHDAACHHGWMDGWMGWMDGYVRVAHVCMFIFIYAYYSTCMYVPMYVRMCVYVCICIYMYVNVCGCYVDSSMCMYV